MKLMNITKTEYANIDENMSLPIKRDSKTVENLHELFNKSYSDLFWKGFASDEDETLQYDLYLKYFKDHPEKLKDLQQTDITQFCTELFHYNSRRELYFLSGQFLSALINLHFEKTHTKEKYMLIIESLEEKVDFLGFFAKANIEIRGNVGRSTGTQLNGGKIKIYGNAGTHLGREMNYGDITLFGDCKSNAGELMMGGNITINGNAGDFLGINMSGGTIIANKDVKSNVGHDMRGGEIYLNDTYESIAYHFNSGKIYHKNKVIMSPFRNIIRKIKRRIIE